jgi:type VII secretion protein EccB
VASRRDELQAYQFLKQRVIAALVVHQTDPERPPFRRAAVAAYGSLALVLLSLAAAGVYGLLVPVGGKTFKPGKNVIVEKETGDRFVFLGGKLDPVLNYSSALLALGEHAGTTLVARNSLVGLPRGPQVGISGAPDELPDKKHLLPGPWTMCSTPTTNSAGSRVNKSVLFVGQRAGTGTTVGDRAVLLDAPATGRQYLLWHGYRHQITDERTVSLGLALSQESPVEAASAWVDVLPAGPSIAPIPVPGAGYPSRALPSRPGTKTGELFVVQISGNARQYFLAQQDKLVSLSPFQYDIQLAAPATRRAYGGAPRPTQLDPAEVALAGIAPPVKRSDPPRDRPEFVQADSMAAICAAFPPGNNVPQLMVRPPISNSAGVAPGSGGSGTPLADRIAVPPGRAALVNVVPSSGSAAGTTTLVTDLGIRYSLASPDVAKILGYGGVMPIRIPADLAARIPAGPALDPTVARKPN